MPIPVLHVLDSETHRRIVCKSMCVWQVLTAHGEVTVETDILAALSPPGHREGEVIFPGSDVPPHGRSPEAPSRVKHRLSRHHDPLLLFELVDLHSRIVFSSEHRTDLANTAEGRMRCSTMNQFCSPARTSLSLCGHSVVESACTGHSVRAKLTFGMGARMSAMCPSCCRRLKFDACHSACRE